MSIEKEDITYWIGIFCIFAGIVIMAGFFSLSVEQMEAKTRCHCEVQK